MLSFPPSPQVRVLVCTSPVDMRKSFNGLAAEVVNVVQNDPQSGHLFLFFNRRKNMMKALVWEPSGYWVLAKRLEDSRFHIYDRPGSAPNQFEIDAADLALLLDGIDLRMARRRDIQREVQTQLRT